jgi:AcrR family transcriptional regulator
VNRDNSTTSPRSRQGLRRREEYAQATRQAIIDAARRLFCERGYFSTKVMLATTIESIEAMDDPAAILRTVAATGRRIREEFGDIIRVAVTTAPHDQAVFQSLAAATAHYRQAFVPIAQRLLDLGALHGRMDVNQAVDIFWFYFGYAALFTLHDDNGWSWERAEEWLCDQANCALLRNSGS